MNSLLCQYKRERERAFVHTSKERCINLDHPHLDTHRDD
jgi:hypothetical protein